MVHGKGNLHGSAPDSAAVALVLIDVINDLDFPGGERLLNYALPMARRLVALRKRADATGVPTVYVNDNFGRWQSNFNHLIAHCLDDGVPGEPLAKLLRPREHDYFVLKPKHSGFYSTTLDLLLKHLGARTLILTGLAANICVLFTANDAYMRDYSLFVPHDCVASNTGRENQHALEQMELVLKADTRSGSRIDLSALQRSSGRSPKLKRPTRRTRTPHN